MSKRMEEHGLRDCREISCRYDSWSYEPPWKCDCGTKENALDLRNRGHFGREM